MDIAIDCRPLLGGRLSGVEIYTLKLIEQLLKADRENRYLLFTNSSSEKPDLDRFRAENVSILHTRIPNRFLNLSLLFLGRPALDKLIRKTYPDFRTDIFFQPDLRPLAVSAKPLKICVVHDLSFHHFPHFFSLKTRIWYRLLNPKKRLKSYDRIIAVSEATAKDLASTYGIPAEKISVIHEGIDAGFCTGLDDARHDGIRAKYGLPDKYFLFLATHEPRKNLNNLIEAFNRFAQKDDSGIGLVMVGDKNDDIFAKTRISGSSKVIFTGFVREEEKPYLFRGATAFLYPSFFEGFGLPLLEAMKCGTPIITSSVSSMPEVCGDAALYVNPESVSDLVSAMEKICDKSVRGGLNKKMEQRIKLFSWKKCASMTLDLFRSTLNGKRNP